MIILFFFINYYWYYKNEMFYLLNIYFVSALLSIMIFMFFLRIYSYS